MAVGEYTNPNKSVQYDYMGNSQIVDATGRKLASRDREMGEGIVVHDVQIGAEKPADDLPDGFWIPDVPELYEWAFGNRPDGAEIYYTFTRPHRNKK